VGHPQQNSVCPVNSAANATQERASC
jgi:hypothetical protein